MANSPLSLPRSSPPSKAISVRVGPASKVRTAAKACYQIAHKSQASTRLGRLHPSGSVCLYVRPVGYHVLHTLRSWSRPVMGCCERLRSRRRLGPARLGPAVPRLAPSGCFLREIKLSVWVSTPFARPSFLTPASRLNRAACGLLHRPARPGPARPVSRPAH